MGVLQIWVAAVDPDLTDDGLISPGLGDTVSSVQCSSIILIGVVYTG